MVLSMNKIDSFETNLSLKSIDKLKKSKCFNKSIFA